MDGKVARKSFAGTKASFQVLHFPFHIEGNRHAKSLENPTSPRIVPSE